MFSAFQPGPGSKRVIPRATLAVSAPRSFSAYRNFKHHFPSATALYAPRGASSIASQFTKARLFSAELRPSLRQIFLNAHAGASASRAHPPVLAKTRPRSSIKPPETDPPAAPVRDALRVHEEEPSLQPQQQQSGESFVLWMLGGHRASLAAGIAAPSQRAAQKEAVRYSMGPVN